jgi:DNA-binding response OmpR family regulator
MRKVLMVGGQRLAPFHQGLEDDGYEVVLRAPGEATAAHGPSPDVLIIELDTAAEDEEVKRHLLGATGGDSPAIIAVLDPGRLDALDPALGFDDFLAASAAPAELSIRIRQALWRRTGVDARNVLRWSDLEMDLANYTVTLEGRPIDLTYKEYELLRFLATNPDRVLSRETLLNKVWGYDFYGGARTVDVHIRRLRSKIEERHHTFIETVRNVGYRFRTSG